MITIDRVTPKVSKTTNKPYVEIEASGRTLISFDLTWQRYVGREVSPSHIVPSKAPRFKDKLPDTSKVFGAVDPRAAVPLVSQVGVPNGLQAQQTTNERFEILNRKIDRVLEILTAHFKT